MSEHPPAYESARSPTLAVRYDPECPLCRWEGERLIRLSGGRIRAEPLESAARAGMHAQQTRLVLPDGETLTGGAALFRAMSLRPSLRPVYWCYRIPGCRRVLEAGCRWFVSSRYRLSAATGASGVCPRHFRAGVAVPHLTAVPIDSLPTFRRAAKVFLVLLGFLHLAAFAGLYPQVITLIGREGLMPVSEILENIRSSDLEHPYWSFPTLFWLSASDLALRGGCVAGVMLSLCVIAGWFRRTALVLLGALYISYSVAGTTFFSFQWDNLLIETTLHALLLPSYARALTGGPARALAARMRAPHPSAVFLMHWLLFRVYFESGLAKIQAAGGGWRDLSAMSFYYDTAPLPTCVGWYFHNLPGWWHQWESALTLLVEIVLPVFIFSSRRWRRPLFVVFTGFQSVILLTANYGLFNYNTLALGLFLLDDRDFEGLVRAGRRLRSWLTRERRMPDSADALYVPASPIVVGRPVVLFIATALIVAASLLEFFLIVADGGVRKPVSEWRKGYAQLRLVNSYHLFASMTRERLVPEIQGLSPAGEWIAYPWKFAPGDPAEAPRLVAPYHPRLDFQIWFVTLSGPLEQRHPWFVRLLQMLSQRPDRAAEFFRDDPFKEGPPSRIRVMLVRYNLSAPADRGVWWRREAVQPLTREIPCSAKAS